MSVCNFKHRRATRTHGGDVNVSVEMWSSMQTRDCERRRDMSVEQENGENGIRMRSATAHLIDPIIDNMVRALTMGAPKGKQSAMCDEGVWSAF